MKLKRYCRRFLSKHILKLKKKELTLIIKFLSSLIHPRFKWFVITVFTVCCIAFGYVESAQKEHIYYEKTQNVNWLSERNV